MFHIAHIVANTCRFPVMMRYALLEAIVS